MLTLALQLVAFRLSLYYSSQSDVTFTVLVKGKTLPLNGLNAGYGNSPCFVRYLPAVLLFYQGWCERSISISQNQANQIF